MKFWHIEQFFFLHRRLCPDLDFFQRATDYPCKDIMNADVMVETLRKRVEQTVLQSETIKVDRMGKSNVSGGGGGQKESGTNRAAIKNY